MVRAGFSCWCRLSNVETMQKKLLQGAAVHAGFANNFE